MQATRTHHLIPRFGLVAAAMSGMLLLAGCTRGTTPSTGTGAVRQSATGTVRFDFTTSTGSQALRVSSTGASSLSTTDPLSIQADKLAVSSGDAVLYTITARNRTSATISQVRIEARYSTERLRITDAQGGTINDGRIEWTIPSLPANQAVLVQMRGIVQSSVRLGDTIRMTVSMRGDNLLSPPSAAVEVRVSSAAGSVEQRSVSPLISSAQPFAQGNQTVVLRHELSTTEVQPGGRVQYVVTLRNATDAPLSGLRLQVQFPSEKMTISDVGGGTINGNQLVWNLPTLDGGQLQAFRYQGTLRSNLRQPDTVQTVAQIQGGIGGSSATSVAVVRVISRLPATGAEDDYFAPLEDTRKYLRPYQQ